MAYWRAGEFSEHLRGHHDDSAPGAVKYRNTSRDSRSDRFNFLFCRGPAISLSVIAPRLQGLHEEEDYITWFAAQFYLDSLVWVANGLSLSTRLRLVHVS